MPTEARGNYFPEPPYLRETKDLSQPATRVDTTCGQLFRPVINTAHFYFFVAEVMSNYLTTDWLKKISLLPEAPWGLRLVAFATSATWLIRHWLTSLHYKTFMTNLSITFTSLSSLLWMQKVASVRTKFVNENLIHTVWRGAGLNWSLS